MEEGIFYVELLNGPGTGDSSGEHHANSGQFHNWVEGLIVVNPEALSETPKDPTELVRENSFVGDNVGALRLGNQLQFLIRVPYSSSIAARQWGSASAA
jgi:hypothetical protein